MAQKMEIDYSSTIEEEIPKNRDLALKNNKLALAIENLLGLEKQTRQGGDIKSTGKIAAAIVRICFEAKQWKELTDNIIYLTKRRGQEKQVVKEMVQEAMTFINQFTPEEENVKMELIANLRTITEGKIYVENERARLTKILSDIKEREGKISEAATILQEVAVETYGSMEKREKIEFILEQIRLCLASGDFIRASIISRKIQKRALSDPLLQDLKLRFYILMAEYYSHDGNHLEIARSYLSIYDTDSVKSDKEKLDSYLRLVVTYIILSPHDPEQSDLLNRVYLDKNLDRLPKYRLLLKQFLTVELMSWKNLEQEWSPEFGKLKVFEGEAGKKLMSDFRKRVIAHNLKVIENYYSRITAPRLAQLLDLSPEETEEFLSELVVSKTIYARIDRPKGIVSFAKPKDPNEYLNDWSSNVSNLLDLVEKTVHLIHREQMVHSVKK